MARKNKQKAASETICVYMRGFWPIFSINGFLSFRRQFGIFLGDRKSQKEKDWAEPEATVYFK
jgi:hypothetical protein